MQEWVARERPDVVCLQEIKAAPDQMPAALCEMEGYWCYWHGGKGYSGVALHVRKEAFPERPVFSHPTFDFETRIVTGAARAAHGRRRSTCRTAARTSRRRCGSSRRMDEYARAAAGGGRAAGAVRRPERRAHGDATSTRRSASRAPSASCPRNARCSSGSSARGLVDVGRALDPDNDQLFTWWAPWRNMRQRNIGWRLDYVLASTALAARAARCPVLPRGRHERPRAGDGGVRRRTGELLLIPEPASVDGSPRSVTPRPLPDKRVVRQPK